MAQKRTDREREIDNSFSKYSLDVVAKPVDTYVAPAKAVDHTSDSRYLALSLSQLADPLMALALEKKKEAREKGMQEGELLYAQYGMRKSYKDFMEANPSIPRNPYMKEGYVNARASNEAAIFRQQINQKYNSGQATIGLPDGTIINVKESDDPAVFDSWIRNEKSAFIDANMGSYEEIDRAAFSNVFSPEIDKAAAALAGEHIDERQRIHRTQTITEYTGVMHNVWDAYLENGVFSVDDVAMNTITEQLDMITAQMQVQGLSRDEIAQAVTNAMLGAADQNEYPDIDRLLEIASNVQIADGQALKNFPERFKQIQEGIDQIENQNERRRDRERKDLERRHQEAIDAKGIEILDSALDKDVPARKVMSMIREYMAMDGQDPAKANQLLNIIDNFYDSRHPKPTGGGSNADAEAAQLLNFVAPFYEEGRQWTVGEAMAANVDPKSKLKLVQNAFNPTLSGDSMFFSNMGYINGRLETTLGQGKIKLDDDPALSAIATGVRVELQEKIKEKIKGREQEYANNPAAYQTLLDTVIDEEAVKWRERVTREPVFRSSGVTIDDYKGQDQVLRTSLVIESNPDPLIKAVEEHEKAVANGANPNGTEFAKVLRQSGKSKAEYEAILGRSITGEFAISPRGRKQRKIQSAGFGSVFEKQR